MTKPQHLTKRGICRKYSICEATLDKDRKDARFPPRLAHFGKPYRWAYKAIVSFYRELYRDMEPGR